ncbi:MAG: NADPH-dependent assimilatory sulfite reductase hemoprotein subunit, partial [Pseudomonadota bacterium]
KAFSFMIRVRVPAGVATAAQWRAMDDIASTYANGSIRLTTRQAFQFHGVIKSNLKTTMQEINASLLDTLAACGDVNRNVMATANPFLSQRHRDAADLATALSDHLSPRTGAYHEIWLDGQQVSVDGTPLKALAANDTSDEEPIYGQHYLPRKFKTVVAVPPDNDVDLYAHDLGFVAIEEDGKLVGWNVTVGGGMGMTHGDTDTFPRTADVLGFCAPDQAVDVAEKIVTVQRDWGNRENRKRARLKYTIETRGLDAFRDEVEARLGYRLDAPRPFAFERTGDRIGWVKGRDRRWHLTLSIENGRIADRGDWRLKSALRAIAEAHDVTFILTGNQNLVIARATAKTKAAIDATLAEHGVAPEALSGLRRNAMACVALPTCALALAESERYLPSLVTRLEESLDRAGLADDEITIRMTGCPNGCARPFLAEIGLVGRGPQTYNLYLGAAFDGSRLNKLYRADVKEAEIIALLDPLFADYARDREAGERFGDFVVRTGVVAATTEGATFHETEAA